MIVISNICILLLVTSCLFIGSICIVSSWSLNVRATQKEVVITIILFLLLMGAIMPRLVTWLF